MSRRKALRDNLVKGKNGELVLGQWEAIVEPDHVANRSGSAVRKHLGAVLFRCGECGEPMRTRARYYSRKTGHLNRTRDAIDAFVRALVVARLQKKDLKRRKKQADHEVKDAFSERIAQQRARIARAERDYDAEVIEGTELARIRETARAEIARLEAERLTSGTGTMLAPILGHQTPQQLSWRLPSPCNAR